MSDTPIFPDARLAGANAALLRQALVSDHGVDPDYVDVVVSRHATAVPYLQDGRVHTEGLAALAARVAADVPAKFKTEPAPGHGNGGDAYTAIRADVERQAATRQRTSITGAERLARGPR